MTIRELQANEWDRLKDHEIFAKTGMPDSLTAKIMIAENHVGQIIGFQVLLLVPHAEPIWIDPSYRGGMAASRLWKGMLKLLDSLSLDVLICNSDRPEIDGYLSRLGLRELPYKTFLYDPNAKFPKVMS